MSASNQRTLVLVELFDNNQSVPPIVISVSGSLTLTRGTVLTAGQLTINATGGAGGYSYAASGLASVGLSLSGNSIVGTVAGTQGQYTVTVTVTDSASNSEHANFIVTLPSRLVCTSGVIPNCVNGKTYSFSNTVTGATGSVTWSNPSGTLPAGMSLNSGSGALTSSNITQAASTTPFTGIIRATDGGSGDTLDIPYSIYTFPGGAVGAWTEPLLPFAVTNGSSVLDNSYRLVEGQTYTFVVDMTNARGAGYPNIGLGVQWQFISDSPSSGSQPSWISCVQVSQYQALLICRPPIGWSAKHDVPSTNTYYNALCSFTRFDAYGAVQTVNYNSLQLQGVILYVVPPQAPIIPQQSSTTVGAANFKYLNFMGSGIGTLSNDGTTLTVPIGNGITDYYGAASGTNTYTATTGATAYSTGETFEIKFTNANTGAATLNCDSLGAKAIQQTGTALTGGEIQANGTYELVYDGTQFQLIGARATSGSVTTVTTSVTLTGTGASNIVIVNAASLTLTLPASPSAGDTFQFVPTLLCTSLTINPNGNKIHTMSGNQACDILNADGSVIAFAMVYSNSTQGWTFY